MFLGDLCQRHSCTAVKDDLFAIDLEWRAARFVRPSNLARLIPARTRSTMRFFSSSAIAPTITTMARPKGPPVSRGN